MLSVTEVNIPEDTVITCEEYSYYVAPWLNIGEYGVLDAYGILTADDGSCVEVAEMVVDVDIDMCFEGTITRTWILSDGYTTCTQVIYVHQESDWVVSFPQDTMINCNDLPLAYGGEPEIFFDECELIATSYDDLVLTAVDDACYKIVRTWIVVNWCLFEEFGADVYQEISEADAGIDFDGDGDMDDHTFQDGVTVEGEGDGYITYTQIIKVIDNEAPVLYMDDLTLCTTDAENCLGTIELPLPDSVQDCSDDLTFWVFTNLPNGDGFGPYYDVPAGTYFALYSVTDNCGNVGSQYVSVEVVDCTPPVAECINNATANINSQGIANVLAIALNGGSYDNCSDQLTYSFSEDVEDQMRVYDCSQLGTYTVDVWVTDESGNQGICQTQLSIVDSQGNCDGLMEITGQVSREDGNMLKGASIYVNGSTNDTTNVNGEYELSLYSGYDYTIKPYKNDDLLNGVTTFDIVLLKQHVLGIAPLESPYLIIAADIDHSGSVTTLDAVWLKKAILGLESGFPNNTSWRFVPSDFVFPNPSNPWADGGFPEQYDFFPLNWGVTDLNFTAIKIGDLNGTALTDQANGNGTEERNMEGEMPLYVPDRSFRTGDLIQIPVRIPKKELFGLQFSLKILPSTLEFVSLQAENMDAEDWGFAAYPEAGIVNFSWSDAYARGFEEEETVCTLLFKAKQKGILSEALSLNESYLKPEAYAKGNERLSLYLEFDSQNGTSLPPAFALLSNRPNPFSGTTVIPFSIPSSAEVTFTITSVKGDVVKQWSALYPAGYSEIEIDMSGYSGVYYYRIEAGEFTATRKMVILE